MVLLPWVAPADSHLVSTTFSVLSTARPLVSLLLWDGSTQVRRWLPDYTRRTGTRAKARRTSDVAGPGPVRLESGRRAPVTPLVLPSGSGFVSSGTWPPVDWGPRGSDPGDD